VKRLELTRIRTCKRCGRGSAEFASADGDRLVVPLDPVRTRQLTGGAVAGDVRSLTDVVLERLTAANVGPSEIVLDIADGKLCGLVSLGTDGDVVACTADEAVALAVRGDIRLYASDEALAPARPRAPERAGGAGGTGTIH
jgi:hypothetical protein